MPETFAVGRHAGVLVPLFSIASRASWGIGEIPDLPRFARWLRAAGLDILQILPVNEMADGQNSPYSALSAMATDPIYIAIGEVEEFSAAGGEASLSEEARTELEAVRGGTRVDYGRTRALKSRALRAAFDRFDAREWQAGSARAESFRAFMRREDWWLDGYSVFRALHGENHGRHWTGWKPGERDRTSAAIDAVRVRLGREILYRSWLQWIADEQWKRARADAAPAGILGDFPFMVSGDSADVWWRQDEFRIDVSVGVPPDAFSETGQDWGLPAYRWDLIRERGYEWLQQRARRCVELYDGFRLDHLVGFYRTFMRERDGRAHFDPPDEPSQLAQGERVLGLLRESGAFILAEDLGTVPDFVRASLSRLQVPGMKVVRWEREWDVEGRPFRAPASYPPVSVATSGTHDTETMAEWWEAADRDERRRVVTLPPLRDAGVTAADPYSDRIRDCLLDALYGAGSNVLLLPLQDVFGWRDRINTPAVIDHVNWTWRLPWPIDDFASEPAAVERASFLRALGRRHSRATFSASPRDDPETARRR